MAKQSVKARSVQLSDAIVLADPQLFSWFVCGVDLWWKQIEIMEALTKYRRVAVKACNASSKTKTAAIAALWWVSAFADLGASAITTSSSWAQVEKVIWQEIHTLIFAAAQRGFQYPAANKTDLEMPMGGFIHGMSTNDAVNFHGFHGKRVLFMKDESTGIDPSIHEAIDSVAAGGWVVQVDLGNPVTTSGAFNDMFVDPLVHQITIDAFESPNYVIGPAEAEALFLRHRWLDGDVPEEGRFLTVDELCRFGDADSSDGGFLDVFAKEPLAGGKRDYLVGRRFAWDVYQRYGVDSPYWQSHVRGEFPDEGSDTLIPSLWVKDALRLAEKDPDMARPTLPLVGGLDVSGPGNDETVLTIRGGKVPILEKAWYGMSSQRTINEIVDTLNPYLGQLEYVGVDSIVIGHHMCGALATAGIPIVPIDVGLAPTPGNTQRFANLKAQLYWGFRCLFEDTHNAAVHGPVHEPGIVIPAGVMSDVTLAQISSMRFEENERGQMTMERKKDLKKRGVPSPDRAESWMLCYATLVQSRMERDFSLKLGPAPVQAGKGQSRFMEARRAAKWARVSKEIVRLYPQGMKPKGW